MSTEALVSSQVSADAATHLDDTASPEIFVDKLLNDHNSSLKNIENSNEGHEPTVSTNMDICSPSICLPQNKNLFNSGDMTEINNAELACVQKEVTDTTMLDKLDNSVERCQSEAADNTSAEMGSHDSSDEVMDQASDPSSNNSLCANDQLDAFMSDNGLLSSCEDVEAKLFEKQADFEMERITNEERGAAGSAAAGPSAKSSDVNNSFVYQVKWISFKGEQIGIVTQNENGPCPLLALMNILLLRRSVKLNAGTKKVTSEQLLEYLADYIFQHPPTNPSEEFQANYEQNLADAINVFHKLQTGLDVNVRFARVNEFEYTQECIVFDILGIHLYHGWLVDPQNYVEVEAVGNCSYNQLVEKIISNKASENPNHMEQALVADDFLCRTSHQLTYHGLSELNTTLAHDDLCVFFRNNHFSTLYKHKKELFLLVTDQGLLHEPNVCWETLSNVEGDSYFVDADFHTYQKPEPVAMDPKFTVSSPTQIETDFLVALSLQEEQQSQLTDMDQVAGAYPIHGVHTLSDHELALQLQEEDRLAAQHSQQQQRVGSPGHQVAAAESTSTDSRRKSNKDCLIL